MLPQKRHGNLTLHLDSSLNPMLYRCSPNAGIFFIGVPIQP